MDIDRFRRLPLLGILRGITAAEVLPLAEAVAAAGLEAIEITMNTPGAPALIRCMAAEAKGRLMALRRYGTLCKQMAQRCRSSLALHVNELTS